MSLLFPHIYVSVETLPPLTFPAFVVRHGGGVLTFIDPLATVAELTDWCCRHLTVDERNAYRSAFGLPPVGQPIPDGWLARRFTDVVRVPPWMILTGRPVARAHDANDEVEQLRALWAAS